MKAEDLVQGKLYWVAHEVVEFAYMGGTGYAIFHPYGEPGMQDSFGVLPEKVDREATGDEIRDQLLKDGWQDSQIEEVVKQSFPSAKGVKGFLLYSPQDHKHFFRVYDPKDKSKFKDYKLSAEDIEIEILDPHITLEDGKVNYTKKVLGIK